ncbi:MAG: hypothetical protein GY858_09720, partial [Candidatus Omnitrophica bacterium]|nr:hypothetical protein [Candidatus Omnitrophota bacterium]
MKIKTKKQRLLFEAICVGVGLCILIGLGWILKGGKSPLTTAKSHTSVLPVMSPPGEMLSQSSDFTPTVIKGLKVYPDKPFHFDFIVDNGDSKLKDKELEAESIELVKYFLAALTTPEDDLWVNLSPYEQDRIVPEDFGQTSMGRDLLAQDYILKQLMSSLTYPESELGKKFWQKVYAKAQEKLGTTNIPVNTFNKVWIIPDKAIVYEGEDTAYIVDSHLKVMLEEDYVALRATDQRPQTKDRRPGEICGISSKIMREIVLPVLEQEINQGENFAQ